MQGTEIWPYYQLVYAQTRIFTGEWDTLNSLGFLDTNGSPNPGQKTRPSDNLKKRTGGLQSEKQRQQTEVDAGKAPHLRHAANLPQPSGAVYQVLTLLERVRFIDWRLRRPFLWEGWWDTRYSLIHRVCQSYGPAPKTTLQKTLYLNVKQGAF